MYLLDANICIAWMRKSNAGVLGRIQSEPPVRLSTCSVVLGELVYGALHSANSPKHLQLIERLRHAMVSHTFDDQAAETYRHIRQDLSARGLLIGPNDLLIASIALTHGLIVVTRNVAEFRRVAGLTVEDWHAQV